MTVSDQIEHDPPSTPPGDAAEPIYTTRGERLGYGAYFGGQNIFYMLVFLFLVTFLTDVGIPAGTVAGILLAVKVWDAVNDPIFGGIVDKVRLKGGKFRPWLRISVALVPPITILLFALPAHIPLAAKVAWAVVAYLLWDTAYTICDVPVFGLVTTMTANIAERTRLISYGRLAAGIATGIVGIAVPIAHSRIGWAPLVVGLSILGAILMGLLAVTARERVEPREAATSVGLKELGQFLAGNKYLWIFFAAMVVNQALGVSNALNLYMARHILGGEDMMVPFALIAGVAGVLVAFMTPALIRHADKYWWYVGSLTAGAVLSIAFYFVGYANFTLFVIGFTVRAFVTALPGVLMFMFTPDCLEYGMYENGIPAAGMSFALQTFTVKLAAALAAALAAVSLAAIGFVEGENAVQPPGFADRLWLVYLVIPSVGALLSLPILWRYKLRDKIVQVMADYNAGRIERAEAEARIAALS
jgi:probable glucitol transport protein GutA